MGAFAEELREFDRERVQVLALTAEDEENARKMTEKVEPGFPILYGLDAGEVREKIGSYVQEDADPPFLHATGVILDPDGRVRTAVYSSAAVGRLMPEPSLATIRHMKEQDDDDE